MAPQLLPRHRHFLFGWLRPGQPNARQPIITGRPQHDNRCFRSRPRLGCSHHPGHPKTRTLKGTIAHQVLEGPCLKTIAGKFNNTRTAVGQTSNKMVGSQGPQTLDGHRHSYVDLCQRASKTSDRISAPICKPVHFGCHTEARKSVL